MTYTSRKFGFNGKLLEYVTTSVLPRRDLLSNVDKHAGSQHWIDCNSVSFKSCHSDFRTYCILIANCGVTNAFNPNVSTCICNTVQNQWRVYNCYNVTNYNITQYLL